MPKNSGTNYIGTCCILVALGSIPDLSADSCNEIKANEGQSVSSGKYWVQVKSASFTKVALTYCDMETGGEYIKQNLRQDLYILVDKNLKSSVLTAFFTDISKHFAYNTSVFLFFFFIFFFSFGNKMFCENQSY